MAASALLPALCSQGDPAQPHGAQPPGALPAAGCTPLCSQAGGRLEGEGAVGGRHCHLEESLW